MSGRDWVKEVGEASQDIIDKFCDYLDWTNGENKHLLIGSIHGHGSEHCEVVLFYKEVYRIAGYGELDSDLEITHAEEITDLD